MPCARPTEPARAGKSGESLREALHCARDLVDLANETLASWPAIRRQANTPAARRCTRRSSSRPWRTCSGRSTRHTDMPGPLHAPLLLIRSPTRDSAPRSRAARRRNGRERGRGASWRSSPYGEGKRSADRFTKPASLRRHPETRDAAHHPATCQWAWRGHSSLE